MAVNLIEKLLLEAVKTGGTYVEFVVSEDEIAFICNGGFRKSTRHYRQTKSIKVHLIVTRQTGKIKWSNIFLKRNNLYTP